MAKLVTLENDGSKSTLDSNTLGGTGGLSTISGTLNSNFSFENDSVITTVLSAVITNANLKTFFYLPQETSETSLDDFKLNGVVANIENIVDNVSFDIRFSATNNASGIYTIKYIINY